MREDEVQIDVSEDEAVDVAKHALASTGVKVREATAKRVKGIRGCSY